MGYQEKKALHHFKANLYFFKSFENFSNLPYEKDLDKSTLLKLEKKTFLKDFFLQLGTSKD